jgi:hypothetical protein
VELISTPIQEVTETGIVTNDGIKRDFDVIVWATGYEVVGSTIPNLTCEQHTEQISLGHTRLRLECQCSWSPRKGTGRILVRVERAGSVSRCRSAGCKSSSISLFAVAHIRSHSGLITSSWSAQTVCYILPVCAQIENADFLPSS